jgi:energy-coupling factor transporter ATP-binding protein EcfA2
MTIHGVKGIEHGTTEIPIENALYAIVEHNGAGKSAVMSCLLQLIDNNRLARYLKEKDYSNEASYVEFIFNGKENRWIHKNNDRVLSLKKSSAAGGLFYGFRFNDSKKRGGLLYQGRINEADIQIPTLLPLNTWALFYITNQIIILIIKKIRNRNVPAQLRLTR